MSLKCFWLNLPVGCPWFIHTHPVALLQLANSEKERRVENVQKVCYSQQEARHGSVE